MPYYNLVVCWVISTLLFVACYHGNDTDTVLYYNIASLPLSVPPPSLPPYSYEQSLQALADSEARRETSDKEMKLVSLLTPSPLLSPHKHLCYHWARRYGKDVYSKMSIV